MTQPTNKRFVTEAALADPTSFPRTTLNNAYVVLSGPTKHAPALGMWFPEAEGATGGSDDSAAVQAAINAAETAGGGKVWVSRVHNIATGLLQPSNVAIEGAGKGGQVGGPSKLVYTGTSGGTLLGPKAPSTDTINRTVKGLNLDGGGLAAVVLSMYRTSYSRLQDVAVFGALATTGVGVLFDANVSNQCYFNTADNVKVDGVAIGVVFQRGANANRWQGGKVGNGGTGMQFLSLSSGNLVIGTDMESASVKHVYADASSNVFVGCHMESAPIGFDITANGSDTRRFGNTFAGTVTTWVADATAIGSGGPSLDRFDADTSILRMGALSVKSKFLSSTTTLDFDPAAFGGTANVNVRFLRNVTTSGTRTVVIHKGDGTSTQGVLLDGGKGAISAGDVAVGGAAGSSIGLADGTAPTGNPSGGGVAWGTTGALRWRTTQGTISTVAGDVVAKSANYTMTAADQTCLATAGSGGITITLPNPTQGARFQIKKVDSGIGGVTVTPNSGTIDGLSSKVIRAQHNMVEVVSDGTNWYSLGRDMDKLSLTAARFYPSAIGQYHSADMLCTGTRTTSQTYQQVVASPVFTGPSGFTVSAWSVNVATAIASGVYRIGVWLIDNQADPFAFTAAVKYATLLRDVGAATGTIDISTTGNKNLVDTYVLPANAWVLIGGVTQGATGANLTIGTNSQGIYSPYGLLGAGAGLNTGALVGVKQDTVTGALGDFTPSGGSAIGHGVAFNRSA